jgi:hypothetical protein
MIMTPALRKITLAAHLTCSVGWIGAVIAYLCLVIAAMGSQDSQTLRIAWGAMKLIGWYVIVPLALTSLLTGLVMSLGTHWGLFRHYWVLLSLVLTSVAAGVLVQHMQTVNYFASLAVENPTSATSGLHGELLHAGVGLLVLVVVQVLNVYKPRGMTPYGWRKQQEQRMVSQQSQLTAADRP